MQTTLGANERASLSVKALLFTLTFLLVFGWKITAALDLIPLVSVVLALWVFVFSRTELGMMDAVVVIGMAALVVYSAALVIVSGALDTQLVLRNARALINFIGAVALVTIFVQVYATRAPRAIMAYLYWVIALHACLIVAMFLIPSLRQQIYALTSAAAYVNNNSPFLLGYRVPGLTYGLSSTSVVQMSGLLLLPGVLANERVRVLARTFTYLGAVAIVGSLFLTGRSGLLFAIVLVPLAFFLSRTRGRTRSVRTRGTLVALLVAAVPICVFAALQWEAISEKLAYNIERAQEVAEFFSEGGNTETTARLSEMYFVPDDPATLLFGSANLGRGELGYIESDVGYIKLIFALGLVGSLLVLWPYFVGLWLAGTCLLRGYALEAATACLLCLVSGLALNLKELALLTRNQWSIQALLIAVCAVQVGHRAWRAYAGERLEHA